MGRLQRRTAETQTISFKRKIPIKRSTMTKALENGFSFGMPKIRERFGPVVLHQPFLSISFEGWTSWTRLQRALNGGEPQDHKDGKHVRGHAAAQAQAQPPCKGGGSEVTVAELTSSLSPPCMLPMTRASRPGKQKQGSTGRDGRPGSL